MFLIMGWIMDCFVSFNQRDGFTATFLTELLTIVRSLDSSMSGVKLLDSLSFTHTNISDTHYDYELGHSTPLCYFSFWAHNDQPLWIVYHQILLNFYLKPFSGSRTEVILFLAAIAALYVHLSVRSSLRRLVRPFVNNECQQVY